MNNFRRSLFKKVPGTFFPKKVPGTFFPWEAYDDRILGHGDFVEAILKKTGEAPIAKKTCEAVLKEAAELSGVDQQEILRPGHGHKAAQARAIYCYMAKEAAGVDGTILCGQLGLSRSGISRLLEKGRRLLCAQGK